MDRRSWRAAESGQDWSDLARTSTLSRKDIQYGAPANTRGCLSYLCVPVVPNAFPGMEKTFRYVDELLHESRAIL